MLDFYLKSLRYTASSSTKPILPHEAMKLMFKHHLSATWPRRKLALPRHPLITCIKTHNPQLGLLRPAS